MSILLVLISQLFSSSLEAQEITIKKMKNSFVLTGATCQELIAEKNNFCRWSNNQTELLKPNNSCARSNKNFTLDISNCIPDFVKKYSFQKPLHHGANCWGTAMSAHQYSKLPRFMWSEEILYWMNDSGLCRKLDVGEAKMPGYIINVFAPEFLFEYEYYDEGPGTQFWNTLYPGRKQNTPIDKLRSYTGFHRILHSETYISEHFTFGKDSPSKLDEYKIRPILDVYGRPRNEYKNCQENQSLAPHLREYANKAKAIKGSTCDYFTQVYRCENYQTYLEKQNLNDYETSLVSSANKLQELQIKLHDVAFSKDLKLSKNEIDHLVVVANGHMSEAIRRLKSKDITKNEEILLTQLYFSGASIVKGLEFMEFIPEQKPVPHLRVPASVNKK